MKSSGRRMAYGYVVLAAVLWGTLGIYGRILSAAGCTVFQIVFLRAAGAAVELLLLLLVLDRGLLKIRFRDAKLFLGTGILSFVFFNWCYFTAIPLTSLSVAAILLYTAPAIVMALSAVFFGEPLTGRKGASLVLTFVGCALVTGILGTELGALNLKGVLIGLGAGLGYALYSIFGRFALARYHPLTVTFYTFVAATAALIPFSRPLELVGIGAEPRLALLALALSLLGTVAPFLLYTFALGRIEAGRASVTATLEPIVATLVGLSLYGETLSVWQGVGIIMVVSAVVLLSLAHRQP